MQRWSKTRAGTPRFFCRRCHTTATWVRADIRTAHIRNNFTHWLTGKQTLSEIAAIHNVSRRAIEKHFLPLFSEEYPSPQPWCEPKVLVVDGTYVHGNTLCVLVAVDEHDHVFWKFAPRETYLTWMSFLSGLPEPKVVVADGQKGLRAALATLWENVDFQRCQFHVIQLVHKHLTRDPDHEAAKDFLRILYELKNAKTSEKAQAWKIEYKLWEATHERFLKEKKQGGRYVQGRLRAARLAVRNAWPYLFTFLNHAQCPNTTNLAEGWVNAALAEGLRRHRGLRLWQKKTLVSIILANLHRNSKEKPTRKFT